MSIPQVSAWMARWMGALGFMGWLACARLLAQGDAYELVVNAPNTEEPRNYPMGPIGGQYRITDGAPYARIVSLRSGSPGAAAGLQVGDLILGVFGNPLPPAGTKPNGEVQGGHHGVSEELGFAVDRAEGGDGKLPLQVMRPGVGRMDVVVQLAAVGTFGPTYPIASPKYDETYEAAVEYIHDRMMWSNGNNGGGNRGGYFAGWSGSRCWGIRIGTRPAGRGRIATRSTWSATSWSRG